MEHKDLGSAEYVECAVRRGAPAARGERIKSDAPPFIIRQVRVTETRAAHTCTSFFRRDTPLALGDSLGVSVLLQAVERSAENMLLHRNMASLPTIRELQGEQVDDVDDVLVSVSSEVV